MQEKKAQVKATFRSESEAERWCEQHQSMHGALDWFVERVGAVVRVIYTAVSDQMAIIFGRIKDSMPFFSDRACSYTPLD